MLNLNSLHHLLAAEASSQIGMLPKTPWFLHVFLSLSVFFFSPLPFSPRGLHVGPAAWWCRSPAPEPRDSPARGRAAAAPVNPRPARSLTRRAKAAPARATAASPHITPAQR